MTLNWTAEQDASMRNMLSDGVSLTQMAATLGMHRKTLTIRMDELGLNRPKNAVKVWDDAQKSELTRLWNDKWPCRAIAAAIGVSKNAVIGQAHRLGLESRERVAKPKAPRKPRTPHQRTILGKVFAPFAYVPSAADVVPLNISFADLAENSCRYPTGESPITFCGHPKRAASSYCASHHALCWVPWRPTANREQVHADRINRFRAYKAELVEA